MATEIVLIVEPGMDMAMELVIMQKPILSEQRLICPVIQIGTSIAIGLRTTIDTVMEIAGQDTEVMGGRVQDGPGNNDYTGDCTAP